MPQITRIRVFIALVLALTAAIPAIVFAMPKQPPVDVSSVTICHQSGKNQQETLTMDLQSAHPHFQHGDTLGQCAAPLPDIAFGVLIDPAKGYLVEEISDGIYWITEGTYQMMFATYSSPDGDGVIVVDAPPSIGPNILSAISEITTAPITHVIYSHSHADHIGAAGIYPDDATYIAHTDIAEALERNDAADPFREPPFGAFVGGGPVPLPDVTFDSDFTLSVGDKILDLIVIDPSHEAGNIIVHAPEQKVIMLVDVIFPGWTPFKNLALAEDVPGFIEAHNSLLELEWDTLVAGHITRLGTRNDVQTQLDYIMDIRNNAITALQTVDFFGIAQQTGFTNQWLLIDTYLNTVARKCADLTEPDWIDRLGGVDIFTVDHCFSMAESLRID